METDVCQRRVGSVKQLTDLALGCGVVDDQFDALVASEVADDLGVDPWNRLELARPIAVIVRPGEPRCGVRLPFGGHAIVEGCRGNT